MWTLELPIPLSGDEGGWYFNILMSDHFEGVDWPEVSRSPDWEGGSH